MDRKKLFIVGFMGSGKSHIGRCLANSLGLEHYDLDFLLEKKCMLSIKDIFRTYGEKRFRFLERDVLLSSPDSGVISTGGGVVISPKNRAYLQKQFVILLNPPWEIIYERIKKSNRPLVKKHNQQELFQIFQQREKLYREVANFSVDDIKEEDIIRKY